MLTRPQRSPLTGPGAALCVTIWVGSLACGGAPAQPAQPEQAAVDRSSVRDRDSHRATAPDIGEEDHGGLAVSGLRGRLDVYDIREGMRPHSRSLERCYTSRVGQRRYLGGDVEFQFAVERDGTVKSVQVLKSDLGAWPVEKCMLEVCRNMVFPRPKGGGVADFTVPLSFAARARVEVWNETRTKAEVSAMAAQLDTCADQTATRAPANVRITFYVGARGQVQSVGFAGRDDPIADAWADCAAQRVTTWTMSDPRGRVVKAGFTYNPT
ncbi:MAG: AgmX/PglI C-terminal domain-containing protein [Proteobacteria bacterium]|nr:AgmX/PglI C-terminal domain-containing protein [Pseudomonadota bacterium]